MLSSATTTSYGDLFYRASKGVPGGLARTSDQRGTSTGRPHRLCELASRPAAGNRWAGRGGEKDVFLS
jgi:hypothetical protein